MTDLSKKRKPVYLYILILIVLLVLGWVGLMKLFDFTNSHEFHKNKVISMEFKLPITITKKEEPKVVEKIIQPATPEEVDTPIKKYACDKWAKETKTDAYCLTMVAVFQAESGWNNDKYHYNTNNTLDWGIGQINEVHWKTPGCGMIDIVIPDKNIDCAYKIWDRADGKEGNGRGSFQPWVAYNTESYLAQIDK